MTASPIELALKSKSERVVISLLTRSKGLSGITGLIDMKIYLDKLFYIEGGKHIEISILILVLINVNFKVLFLLSKLFLFIDSWRSCGENNQMRELEN